jgi:hypothetical protein
VTDGGAIGRPGLRHPRRAGKLHEEQLVVASEQVVDESIDGRPRRGHLVGRHAAARVEQDAQAHRRPVAAEMRYLLAAAVLEDREVVLGERRHEAPVLVGDGGGDVDQVHAALESEAVLRMRGQAAERGGDQHRKEERAQRDVARCSESVVRSWCDWGCCALRAPVDVRQWSKRRFEPDLVAADVVAGHRHLERRLTAEIERRVVERRVRAGHDVAVAVATGDHRCHRCRIAAAHAHGAR